MSTRQSSLEAAPEATSAGSPHADAEPGAAGKPGTAGTANQEHAADPHHQQPPANQPASAPSHEPSLIDTLLESESAAPPAPQEQERQTDDQPPQDQGRKPQDQPAQDQERKPEDGADQPLKPEQLEKLPTGVRGRLRNLEQRLESATAAVVELERRSEDAGFNQPDEVLAAVDLHGRAFLRRDPAALAEIDAKLTAAGFNRPAAQPPPPRIDLDALESAMQEGEYERAARMISAARTAAAAGQPATEQRAPAQTPEQEAAARAAERTRVEQETAQAKARDDLRLQVARAQGEVQGVYDDLRAAHGEKADDLIVQIKEEVTRRDKAMRAETGAGFRPDRISKVVREVRDLVIAQARDLAQRRPPAQLRSSSPAGSRQPSTSLTDELLAEG